MIKAVLFDFDGVISDSKAMHDNSWKHAINHILNVNITQLPDHDMSGKSPRLIAKALCKFYGKSYMHNELLDYKNSFLNKNAHKIKPFDGTKALFAFLKTQNIPFGIASNASKYFVEKCILNWDFDVVVCYGYEDYDNPKPNPEPYLKLANFLKIDTVDFEDVLVFEDSETGLLAALSAGMKTVYIESHCSVNLDVLDKVNYSFKNLTEALKTVSNI